MKIRHKIVSMLTSAAMLSCSFAFTMTAEAVATLPNTLEQIVSDDGNFDNNEFIYSDRYKFALEHYENPDYPHMNHDWLIVYGISDEDCRSGEWKNHVVLNEELYSYGTDVYHYPTGSDRSICSGWTWLYCALGDYRFENHIDIMFFVEGEVPYTFDSAKEASEAYGFDITPYIAKEIPDAELYGDVNADGIVNVADIVMMNMYLISSDKNAFSSFSEANADCMRDGVIDSFDGVILLNYISQMIEYDELGK